MEFANKIRKVSDEVRSKKNFAKKEASTRSYLVDPFIEEALGFKVNVPQDVEPEFTADLIKNSESVDYAIKLNGNPIVLVEVKQARKGLSGAHTAKLQRYFSTKLDIRFGILTNGLEYQFYADLERPNVMDDNPFLMVNILDLDERTFETLEVFTKSKFNLKTAITAAQRSKDIIKVRSVMQNELNPLSEDIVNYFIGRISGGGTSQSRFDKFAPLVNQEWQAFLKHNSSIQLPQDPESKPPPIQTESKTIIESLPNSLPKDSVELPIFASYQGRRFEAKLHLKLEIILGEKIVAFEGEQLTVSGADKKARRNVNKSKPKSSHGWDFWKFIDPETGERLKIRKLKENKSLRQRLLNLSKADLQQVKERVAEPANDLPSPNKGEYVEIPVYGIYFDKRIEKTLMLSPLSKEGNAYLMSLTRIRWGRNPISVNQAEFKAISSINPDIVQPQWNGWDTWKLRDPRTGKERAIRELLNDQELRGEFL